MQKHFSGSYALEDVEFLLKPIEISSTQRLQKEQQIQNGAKHYSEMITYEQPVSEDYLRLFTQALTTTGPRFIKDVFRLARIINQQYTNAEIVLVSLARAGTPVGILLKRILQQYFNRQVTHYSVSIVRDFGLDENAMLEIIRRGHKAPDVCFVDGWTGKGMIAQTLKQAIKDIQQHHNITFSDELYVVTDISGTAAFAASQDDYLIPTSILNSIVSGLISRTIRGVPELEATDFHGCLYYQQYENIDLSRSVLDTLLTQLQPFILELLQEQLVNAGNCRTLRETSLTLLYWAQKEYKIQSINYIKPGIGESTRVLLRRVPEVVFVQNQDAAEVQHLIQLARDLKVPVITKPDLCYAALTLISDCSTSAEGS